MQTVKAALSLFILLFTALLLDAQQQAQNWDTYYEKSGFLETPRYDKTVRYCKHNVAILSIWFERLQHIIGSCAAILREFRPPAGAPLNIITRQQRHADRTSLATCG